MVASAPVKKAAERFVYEIEGTSMTAVTGENVDYQHYAQALSRYQKEFAEVAREELGVLDLEG